jgi:hypothetical protein
MAEVTALELPEFVKAIEPGPEFLGMRYLDFSAFRSP